MATEHTPTEPSEAQIPIGQIAGAVEAVAQSAAAVAQSAAEVADATSELSRIETEREAARAQATDPAYQQYLVEASRARDAQQYADRIATMLRNDRNHRQRNRFF